MKIAHISDIHVRGLTRHEEYKAVFNNLYQKLKEEIKPDLIVCTGDIWHTKTQGITPEAIELLTNFFDELAGIAPLHMILGNHDGNLANNNRQDAITPILKAMNYKSKKNTKFYNNIGDLQPGIKLYKQSGVYPVYCSDFMIFGDSTVLTSNSHQLKESDFSFCVLSPFDKEGWEQVKPKPDKINICLFHGSVLGCVTDLEHMLEHTEEELRLFDGYDFVMLGDIHQQQFMGHRPDKTGNIKPWIGYPGSLVQQNFGEGVHKGFFVWDIRAKDDWDVDFIILPNDMPFLNIRWMGDVDLTLEQLEDIKPGTRVRVISDEQITQIDRRHLYHELREVKSCSELAYKITNNKDNLKNISTSGLTIHKASLRNDHGTMLQFYRKYITDHLQSMNLQEEELKGAEELIVQYMNKFNESFQEEARDVHWTVKELVFNNLFKYGEGNKINFDKLKGIVGIFGPNRAGKSSIVSSLMYGLFNTTEREVGRGVGHYINKGKKQANCSIRFESGGSEYLIERAVALKENPKEPMASTTTLQLYQIQKDGSKSIVENDVSRTDTDKVLRKLIGTPVDFRLTAYSAQGDIARFIEQGATQRKANLNRFLDLDIFEKLYKTVNDDYNAITARISVYQTDETRESNIQVLSDKITQLEQELQVVQGNIETRKTNIEFIQNTLNNQTNIKNIKLKLVNLRQETEKLSYKLQEFSSVSVKSLDLREQYQTKLSQVEQQLEELSGKLETWREVELLLTTKAKEQQEIKITLDKETIVLTQQEKSVRKLDLVPCGDQFPNCHFIKDSYEDKQKLPVQQAVVLGLKNKHRSLELELEDLIKTEATKSIKQFEQLELTKTKLIKELEDIKSQDLILEDRATLVKEQLQEKLQEVQQLEKEASGYDLDSFDTKQRELLQEQKEITALEQEKSNKIKTVGMLENKKQTVIKQVEELKKGQKQQRILSTILETFSKNGIPALILSSQLPAINEEINKVLQTTVDFKVVLETEVSSNTLDIWIEDSGSKRIIELASGMEKMIAALAIRIALLNLSSLPRPDFFIIDEGFGSLDDDSIMKCLQFIQTFKSVFKTIIVISHISQVKEIAEKIIEITTYENESKVQHI
jgi:DNA repair exonuclease SbcCD ATPase subunit/predicted phosphodiesterase